MVKLAALLGDDGYLLGHDTYLRLPEIPRDAVRMLWAAGWYDGPRSGMLLYCGKRHWFEQCAEEQGEAVDHEDYDVRITQGRRYVIIELTPAQAAEEERWNELFRQKVGTHRDYDEAGQLQPAALRPREMWHEYYDAARERAPLDFVTLANNRVIGWFER